jgi:hypothetical protein
MLIAQSELLTLLSKIPPGRNSQPQTEVVSWLA